MPTTHSPAKPLNLDDIVDGLIKYAAESVPPTQPVEPVEPAQPPGGSGGGGGGDEVQPSPTPDPAPTPGIKPAPTADPGQTPAQRTIESDGGADTAAAAVAAGEPPQAQPEPQAQQAQPQPQAEATPQTETAAEPSRLASVGNWFAENYDLAALPVGLGLMLFGGKIGSVLGALALGGGAYGLWNRFQTLNNAGGPIEIPEGLNEQQAAEYRTNAVTQRIQAMQAAASKGTDSPEWAEWYSDPNNKAFHSTLGIVNKVAPGVVRDTFRSRLTQGVDSAIDSKEGWRSWGPRAARWATDTPALAAGESRRRFGHNIYTDEGWGGMLQSVGLGGQQ